MNRTLTQTEMALSAEARNALQHIRSVGGGYAVRFLELGHVALVEVAALKCADGIAYVRQQPAAPPLRLEQGDESRLREAFMQVVPAPGPNLIGAAIALCRAVIVEVRQHPDPIW